MIYGNGIAADWSINPSKWERFSILIIGGGPNALYCVERILAQVIQSPSLAESLSVSIVDLRGAFGAGCHYPSQPNTNHLNRIAAQISFCADESNKEQVSGLLPKELRHTLYTWCADRFSRTNIERYDVSEREWVERSLFGEASCDVFQTYVYELQSRGVMVETFVDRVVGMHKDGNRYHVSFQSGRPEEHHDAAILCTGHPEARTSESGLCKIYAEHALNNAGFQYIHDVYPIEGINALTVPPGRTVVCRGMGLAAIDVILRLTEGRGGYFVPTGDTIRPLRYERSGFEPDRIYPFSSTGAFIFARAFNQKLNDSGLFETGEFFNRAAIDRMRLSMGGRGALKAQLDFGQQVLPLMIVEMQRIYYSALFGKTAFAAIRPKIRSAVDEFIDGNNPPNADGVPAASMLSEVVTEHYASLAQRLEMALASIGGLAADEVCALETFCSVYSGSTAGASPREAWYFQDTLNQLSPFLHDPSPSKHLFDWHRLIDPLGDYRGLDRVAIGKAALGFFVKDLADATQGNISNPRKAAIDGVWRDMRDTVRYTVEFGGLSPQSQRHFTNEIHRITNRIAVGTSLKMMTKIIALVEDGVIDLSAALSPQISIATNGFSLTRRTDGMQVEGEILINARVHRFDLSTSEDPLYRMLAADGHIREWCVAGSGEEPAFPTGGVEVDSDTNLVVGKDGAINPTLGLLGAPSEGPLYFHLAALRPYCSDPVIVDADRVVCAILTQVPQRRLEKIKAD